MTKVDIMKRIADSEESTKKAVEVLTLVTKDASDRGAQAIAMSLSLIAGCIVESTNTLALILCEMLSEPTPEKAPEKDPEEAPRGKHFSECKDNHPSCLCVTCARDNDGSQDTPCCMAHNKSCICSECPDYVKEG